MGARGEKGKSFFTLNTQFDPYFRMEDQHYARKKKSDKAKEKACRPSQRHVRAYEAMQEKKRLNGGNAQ